MNAAPITARQIEVLAIIAKLHCQHGYAPTVREIGAALGISSSNASADHLKALRRKGLIVWTPRTARTIALTEAGRLAIEGRQATSGGGA